MERLSERAQIVAQGIVTVTSAAGSTSVNGISMEDCESVTFICSMGTVLATATAITPTIAVIQSGDIRLSTNATVASLSTTLGPTTANAITNAKSVVMTMGTASTLTDSITINGNTLTYTTVPNTTNATALSFGSTEGSTVASGLANAMASLSSLINNTTIASLKGLTATTLTTAAIRISADDTASTGVTITSTADTQFALVQEQSQLVLEVKAEDLNSTSKYVGITISTAATSVVLSVVAIKNGIRFSPPYNVGKNIKST